MPIRVGDIGSVVEVTMLDAAGAPEDISTATTLEIKHIKPTTGTVVTKTAAFSTDGTDGKMRWVSTLPSDFDEPGKWRTQAHVVTPSWERHTEEGYITVEKAFGLP